MDVTAWILVNYHYSFLYGSIYIHLQPRLNINTSTLDNVASFENNNDMDDDNSTGTNVPLFIMCQSGKTTVLE